MHSLPLPQSFYPPRPLSSPFLYTQVLALVPSLCYSMVSERLWNCCLASMLTHPMAFPVLILYWVSFLNIRKLAMLCWVSYPDCLWAWFYHNNRLPPSIVCPLESFFWWCQNHFIMLLCLSTAKGLVHVCFLISWVADFSATNLQSSRFLF